LTKPGSDRYDAVVAAVADIASTESVMKNQNYERRENIENEVRLSEADQQDIKKLYETLRKRKAKLVGPDGEVRQLPGSVHSFLVELIGLLTEGKCVYIAQNHSTFTTVEAATMLGVSRQYLVNLLAKGEIAHHMVGTHRRIYARDLLAYKVKRDSQRRTILKDLVEAELADGLYDKVPSTLEN
jgi:excisionase family DNA binding protein